MVRHSNDRVAEVRDYKYCNDLAGIMQRFDGHGAHGIAHA